MVLLHNTAAHQYHIQLQYNKDCHIYDNMGTMDVPINNQVIDFFKDTCLKEFKKSSPGSSGSCSAISLRIL